MSTDKILLDTNVTVVPGVTRAHDLSGYRVHETPVEENWRLGLLVSLLEVRDARWSVMFDKEDGQRIEDETTTILFIFSVTPFQGLCGQPHH